MIQGRDLKDYPWKVFQHGHTGWWWTDERSVVSRNSYKTEAEATTARDEAMKVLQQ